MGEIKKYSGIYVSTLTPFTADYQIDFKVLKNQINYVIDKGIHGLIACGVNGEFSSMSIPERKKVIKTIVDETKKRIPVVAGAYSCSFYETIDLIKYAKEVGADAAIITTPFFFRNPSEEGLYEYFDKILAETNEFPIFFCNVPIYTLVELTHSVIENLRTKYYNIVGIKDLSGKPDTTTAFAGVFEDLAVFSGSDRLVFHGLNVQCDGIVSAIGSIFPEYILKIHESYKKGDIDQAWIDQEALTGIRSLLKMFPSRSAQKFIFSKLQGTGEESFVRPPLRNLSDEDKKKLTIILEDHGLLPQKV